MSPSECSELVRGLFHSHYSSLVAYACRLSGSLELAEEAVQEAFFTLYRQLRNGNRPDVPTAWLFTVVKHETMQRLKKEGRQRIARDSLDDMDTYRLAAAPVPDPFQATDVGKLFQVLTPREEEVLVLRLATLKYKEIGEHLGISPKTVSALLTRALKKLQRAWKEQTGLELPGAHLQDDTAGTLH